MAVIAAALYLRGLGTAALWEPDEGRYAEIAREMAVSGDYITPRDDGLRYFEKPPLVYWCNAAAIRLLGKSEFAVRTPAALFSAAEVGVTFAIADFMFDTTTGVLAALALMLAPLVFAFAVFATLDPALAFFMTAAVGAFYAASREPQFGRGAGYLWMVAAAALLALGTLAKGPVALVLVGVIALAWLWWEQRAPDIMRIPFISCLVVYLAIAAPWFVLAEWRNPGFLRFFFVHEHLQRYLESQEHGWGPWFFVPIVIAGAWPWIYFAPRSLSGFRQQTGTSSAVRLLLTWFAVVFVFFSIPRSKLGSYILPAMPPIAIAAGLGLSSLRNLQPIQARRIVRTFAVVNGAVIVACAIGVFVPLRDVSVSVRIDALIAVAALSLAAIICAAFVTDASHTWVTAGGLALAVLLVSWSAGHLRNGLAELTSYRSLAQSLAPYLTPDCVLGSYRHYVQALPFYTGLRETPVEYFGEIAEFEPANDRPDAFIGRESRLRELWSSQRCFILVANQNDLAPLEKLLSPRPAMLGCEGKKVALANFTPPGLKTPPCCDHR
ncbi:MAG TPA: phospholipid carrier-dependent glycosyltransferase [Candidatus Binataceae bacterium]|nr:phospholipid carrier-dependent glycosyltransferase [Candidatus Binataceae bacterium]